MSKKPVITLKKWGNSIGLLLPAAMANAPHLFQPPAGGRIRESELSLARAGSGS